MRESIPRPVPRRPETAPSAAAGTGANAAGGGGGGILSGAPQARQSSACAEPPPAKFASPGLMAHFALEQLDAFRPASGVGSDGAGRSVERLAECCQLLDCMSVK